jgi:hypothetical protein
MREKIIMFTTYIEFFHKLHTKYLKRFSNKIQLVYKDINSDINFDKPVELNKSNNSINSERKDFVSSSDSESNEITRKNSIAESIDTITTKSSILSKLNSKETIKTADNVYENISLKLSDNEIHKSVSNEEVNEIFLNIESSFDSIINKKENEEVINNIQLSEKNVDSIENNDNVHNVNAYNIESNNYVDEINNESNILLVNESNNTSVIGLEPEKKKKDIYKQNVKIKNKK